MGGRQPSSSGEEASFHVLVRPISNVSTLARRGLRGERRETVLIVLKYWGEECHRFRRHWCCDKKGGRPPRSKNIEWVTATNLPGPHPFKCSAAPIPFWEPYQVRVLPFETAGSRISHIGQPVVQLPQPWEVVTIAWTATLEICCVGLRALSIVRSILLFVLENKKIFRL